MDIILLVLSRKRFLTFVLVVHQVLSLPYFASYDVLRRILHALSFKTAILKIIFSALDVQKYVWLSKSDDVQFPRIFIVTLKPHKKAILFILVATCKFFLSL